MTQHQTQPADIERLITWLLLIAGALLYLSFGYTEMAGSDMWWHVAAGRELVQTGTLWMVDDWSYTALGSEWLNHEWLADLIYYGWASLFGIEALVYWKWLVIVACYLLLQLTLARISGSHLAGFLCAAMAVVIAAPFLDVRPHLYSLLNYSLLLFLLLGRSARLWILALLFVVWVNLHGGFFFGLMALGILLFPWRELNTQTLKVAVFTGLGCAAFAVLNPSGINTFFYPLKYAFDESSPFRTLGEWLPPSAPGGIQAPLFFYFQWAPLAALLYALPAVRKRAGGIPWEGLCLTGLTLAMALTSRRFIPLFGISLAVLLAPLLGVLLGWLWNYARKTLSGVVLGVFMLAIAVWRLYPYPLQAAPAFHYLVAEYTYPVDMLNFIRANALKGRVFAYYNWGGYVHWRTDGDLKVYIDGRADTLYDAATYNNYVAVLKHNSDWRQRLEATEPDFILWPHQRGAGQVKFSTLTESGKWRPVYQDSSAWLLARSDLALPAAPVRSEDSPWRSLSAAWGAGRAGQLLPMRQRAEQARQVMPWHRTACEYVIYGYRREGRNEEALNVLRECLGYFPSSHLR